jgi:hypothetical protein
MRHKNINLLANNFEINFKKRSNIMPHHKTTEHSNSVDMCVWNLQNFSRMLRKIRVGIR